MKWKGKKGLRLRRHLRIRQKIIGTGERPRMVIGFSNCHMRVQFIDDGRGVTLLGMSTEGKSLKNNISGACEFGKLVGQAAREKKITDFVVDRAGFKYHGRLKAIVETVRKVICEKGEVKQK